MLTAYKLRTFQVSGAPDWRDETGRSQLYDIEARAPGDGAPTTDEVRQMLQTLLAERFQLKFHRETKEMPAYDLVVGNNPPRLKPSAPGVESKTTSTSRLRMDYTNVSISELVIRIGPQFDRPLFDKTGLQEVYDFAPGIYAEPPQYGQHARRRRRPLLPSSTLPTKHLPLPVARSNSSLD